MRFSTALYTLAVAAAGITAAPAVEQRQADDFGFVAFHFYELPGCQGSLVTSDLIVDSGADSTGVCKPATPQTFGYASFLVRYNELVRPATLYATSGCAHEAVKAVVNPDTPIYTCFNHQLASWTF